MLLGQLIVEDIDFLTFEVAQGGAEVIDGLVAFGGGDGGVDFFADGFKCRSFGGEAVGYLDDMEAQFSLNESGLVFLKEKYGFGKIGREAVAGHPTEISGAMFGGRVGA